MMAEIYQAFKGQPSLAPSSSVTPTLALTHIPANVEGDNATNNATKEPPSHTKGETGDATMAILISSIQPTHAQSITPIISHPESSQATPRINKGKGIATESEEDPSKRLVPVSTIIHPDPDEPIQVYWDKDEKIKKAVEEAKLLAMYRPEVIKVVREEAKKLGINPKEAIFTKAIPEQASSQTSGRKRKHMELELKVKVPRLECNRSLPEGVPFVNNMVIEEPEYGIFFTDVKTEDNARFSLELRKLIADHPDQEKLKSKKVKLEALGYHWCMTMVVAAGGGGGEWRRVVYVKQPPGFESSEFPYYVCKLDKALYGLKQAPKAWNLLKKYEISDSSLVKTPMVSPNNLGPDLAGKPVNETSYRGMIGSLMYLTATSHDLQFSIILCVRYQSNPNGSHLTAVKRILRYLKGTPTLSLYYPKCSGFDLKGYLDSDYAGFNIDRKSTSSASEAEYVVAAGCCASIIWMKSQLSDYGIHYKMVPIFCVNTSAIAISNNPVLHSRTKHIDIRYHFIRDHILKGDIELHFIPTENQLADIFTKPLDEPTFTRLKAELGMLNID
ncbi:retrovirus-related pol polyprotein from transposon TNT 1-94 [Tanacetum coccineum]|uniref:Retrovirus-related pol polyprotein from transposon TNT 1-94 n=1 Tax=Tanacetum coccineum TaxID=301880 RepID=A0ABQ5FQH2_9ASTR